MVLMISEMWSFNRVSQVVPEMLVLKEKLDLL